jgi:hypothetical protein
MLHAELASVPLSPSTQDTHRKGPRYTAGHEPNGEGEAEKEWDTRRDEIEAPLGPKLGRHEQHRDTRITMSYRPVMGIGGVGYHVRWVTGCQQALHAPGHVVSVLMHAIHRTRLIIPCEWALAEEQCSSRGLEWPRKQPLGLAPPPRQPSITSRTRIRCLACADHEFPRRINELQEGSMGGGKVWDPSTLAAGRFVRCRSSPHGKRNARQEERGCVHKLRPLDEYRFSMLRLLIPRNQSGVGSLSRRSTACEQEHYHFCCFPYVQVPTAVWGASQQRVWI